MKKNEKTCWACKRILLGESKTGLCPDCVNKYGSHAAAIILLAIALGANYLKKNGGKIAKKVMDFTKNFKF